MSAILEGESSIRARFWSQHQQLKKLSTYIIKVEGLLAATILSTASLETNDRGKGPQAPVWEVTREEEKQRVWQQLSPVKRIKGV